MRNPFSIVKDSSIWQNSSAFSAVEHKDPYLRLAIVKKVFRDTRTSDIRYLVQVRDRNDAIELNARTMRRFGGAFNYEDIVNHGYRFDDKPDTTSSFEAKAGDVVLIAFLNGEAREAIILGGLTHPARKSTIDITKGPQYQSEFNGIETVINENGEYKVTFKAIPTNIKKLDEIPDKKLPAPEYDKKVGGSFLMFDKTGSFEINDKAESDLQNFRIDKPKGTVEINSGKIKLTMTKKGEKVELKCKILNITSDDNINGKTKEFKLEASKFVKINSPKVAIGKSGIELLDQLSKLIDAMGKVTPISPVGPCTPLMSTPQWPGVTGVQSKIKEITGSL
jgi:hypothetical protein